MHADVVQNRLAMVTSALKHTVLQLHRLIADPTVFRLLAVCINDCLSAGSLFESLVHNPLTACLLM